MERSKALVVYFSGTGGARRIADAFEKKLTDMQYMVVKHSLDLTEYNKVKNQYEEILKNIKLIFVIYAVHAVDAPLPVYDWIKDLPEGLNIPTVVISVSGGGEVWPNTSCRVYCKKALEKKGYPIFYEKMMVMPSNWMIATNDHACMWLLNSVPRKVQEIVRDALEGKQRKSQVKLSTRFLSYLSHNHKKSMKKYGSSLKVKDTCTGCGWCARNCPRCNITMEGSMPEFHDNCIVCLRCIYGCPSKVIYSEKYRYFSIKEGFSIESIEESMIGETLQPIDKCCKGILFAGIKKYLKE